MSETTDPGQSPDATPTEALQLGDQQPVAAAPTPVPASHSGRRHTRTILEVVGGVVAVGLILLAGVVGFAVGHVTGSDRDGHSGLNSFSARGGQDRPDAGGPMGPQGQGFQGPQGQGFQGPQGQGLQGPQGQGLQGPGMMPGQDPRGIDPDGDNWTGGQQG